MLEKLAQRKTKNNLWRLIEKELYTSERDHKTDKFAITAQSFRKALELPQFQAGIEASIWKIPLACLLCGALAGVLCLQLSTPILAIAASFLFGLAPLLWLQRRIETRAKRFAEDYPSILLAMASSLKAGMTPIAALERAVKLLPEGNIAREEVEKLLGDLWRYSSKEVAISRFASGIRLPEISLFRDAFLLVLEHGGRFAPTLERLARVSRERSILIRSAGVSTASMKLTGNSVLAITPIVLFLSSARSENFWSTLFYHPSAKFMAITGLLTIAFGYAILHKMSRFKP